MLLSPITIARPKALLDGSTEMRKLLHPRFMNSFYDETDRIRRAERLLELLNTMRWTIFSAGERDVMLTASRDEYSPYFTILSGEDKSSDRISAYEELEGYVGYGLRPRPSSITQIELVRFQDLHEQESEIVAIINPRDSVDPIVTRPDGDIFHVAAEDDALQLFYAAGVALTEIPF